MPDQNQTLTFKLVIDGKEAIATIDLTKKEFEGFTDLINKTSERPLIKQFAKDLLLVEASAQEATSGIMDFINYNQMTEKEINSVISTLREEQSVLGVGSAQWVKHGQAIANLTNAYNSTVMQQKLFTTGSSSARMAVSQFGYALGDASMIAVDFRMFLLSIGNNLPFIAQGLSQMARDAKLANISFGDFLKNNIDGSMKLVLGVNAVMFALTVLPTLFNKINEASGEAADDGMKKFTEELKNMTSSQILDNLEKVRKKIKDINKEKTDYSNMISSAGSYPVIQMRSAKPDEKGIDEKETQLTDEEKKIQDARSKRKLALELDIKDYDKLIDQVKKKEGADKEIQDLVDAQAEKQKELDELLKTSAEREEDRKRSTEENKRKYDEYLNSIEKNYTLQKEINEMFNTNNAKNISDTQQLIEKELSHNISLEQKNKLLKLQKQLQDDLNEGLDFFAESQDDMDKAREEYDNNFVAGEKETLKDAEDRKEALDKLNKLQSNARINSIQNLYQKENELDKQKAEEELAFYKRNYSQGIISYEDYLRAKDIIEAEYDRKSRQRDREAFLYKVNTISQLVSTVANAYNQLYSAIETNVKDEISTWKDKEEQKIETEREAALKHASTQAQRERINEQYDKKQTKLEEEANKKARERLAAWFYINQAVSATNAVISSIAAGLNTMELLSKYLPPPLPQIAMATTIAAGFTQAAVITQQKLPGYEKGGIVIGEKGPEIIAPMDSYAEGQAKLIAMTMMTLREEIKSGNAAASIGINNSSNTDLSSIKDAITKLNKHLDDGISARAFLDDREAKKVNARGGFLNRKDKL